MPCTVVVCGFFGDTGKGKNIFYLSLKDKTAVAASSSSLINLFDGEGLEKVLREFHRILKPNGQMAHGELYPIPENDAQKLFIEADSYSLETSTPKARRLKRRARARGRGARIVVSIFLSSTHSKSMACQSRCYPSI